MPAPGVIGRIAAKAMIGADAEEINKAAEKLVAQSEEEVQAYKEMVERQQLEELAERENLPKVYVLKEAFRKLDPATIHELEEKHNCVMIPADEYEIQRMKENAVPYTMPPKLLDIKMLTPAVYDVPHVKGGRYHEPPRDLKKKKKAKRRAEKQARRKRR
jgi:phosphopantetheinyl transferase (holo-ACP synthase)